MKSKNTVAYVDGFNLYWGLRDKGWRRYYWLNLWRLSYHLLRPDQSLTGVNYLTSRVTKPADEKKRQSVYLRALRMTQGIELYYGKYGTTPYTCSNCGHEGETAQEKMTDVQLATTLVRDAFKNNFEVALVVSGDRDLVPAVEVCKAEFPKKRIVSIFPPLRNCDDLRIASDAYYHITESELKKSLFPDTVADKVGNSAQRPIEWV